MGFEGTYHNLALFYKDGLGVPKDIEKAIELLEASAQLGNSKAFGILGTLYRAGDGVTADRQKALKYYIQGAEAGDHSSALSA